MEFEEDFFEFDEDMFSDDEIENPELPRRKKDQGPNVAA